MNVIVRDILERKGSEVLLVTAECSVTDAVASMCERGVGSAIIAGDDGLPTGIVTERDILRQFAKHGTELGGLKVADIMTTPVKTATADASLQDIMKTMTTNRFRHIPIVDGGNLVGILSIGDVVKARLRETETEAESLRQYISS